MQHLWCANSPKKSPHYWDPVYWCRTSRERYECIFRDHGYNIVCTSVAVSCSWRLFGLDLVQTGRYNRNKCARVCVTSQDTAVVYHSLTWSATARASLSILDPASAIFLAALITSEEFFSGPFPLCTHNKWPHSCCDEGPHRHSQPYTNCLLEINFDFINNRIIITAVCYYNSLPYIC